MARDHRFQVVHAGGVEWIQSWGTSPYVALLVSVAVVCLGGATAWRGHRDRVRYRAESARRRAARVREAEFIRAVKVARRE